MNLSPRLSRLFPSGTVAAELSGPGDPKALSPEEAAAARGFAPKRIAEFAAGRTCARRALAELGVHAFALLPNSDRSPRWPAGVVGSITHTGEFCAAVVAEARRFQGIGLDAEAVGRVTRELWSHVFTADDADQCARALDVDRARIATVIFSAKEAFYKCQYALTEQWVEFHDVRVSVAPDTGTFTVRPARVHSAIAPLLPMSGRFLIDGDLVVTGIAIPANA